MMEETKHEEYDLYRWLQQLLAYGAKAADASILVVRIVLGCAAVSWAIGLYVLGWDRSAHWIWTTSYGIVALGPVFVLIYYHWILSSLQEAPAQIATLKETLRRFHKEHPEETKEVLAHKFSSLGKWGTYRLIGKVLKDIIAGAGNISGVAGNLKTLSAMGNPLFWLTLVIAVVVSFLFSGIALLSFSLLLIF